MGALRVHSIHSHDSVLRGEEGLDEGLGEAERRCWRCLGERVGMGEEGGVGSFFMLTKIIAVWSMTEDSSVSICMSIAIV